MKILIISNDNSGCFLHRLALPMLKVKELQPDWQIDFGLSADTLDEACQTINEYDILYFHKMLGDDLWNAIKKNCPKVKKVCDQDDYWKLDTSHCLNFEYNLFHIANKVEQTIKDCDAVTTTTNLIASKIKQLNPNVFVFPNALEVKEQFSTYKYPSNRIRFGILCGSSHNKDMEMIDGFVNQLPADVKAKSQFVLCGMDKGVNKTYDPSTKKLIKEEPMPWEKNIWTYFEKIMSDNYSICSPEHTQFLKQYLYKVDDTYDDGYKRIWTKDIWNYATSYQHLDVLLVPLKKTNFNQYKSPLKMAEAGVTHTACIVSDVEPYSQAIIPYNHKGGQIDINGNCWAIDNVKGTKEWMKAITKMVRNPEIIQQLADNLQRYQQQYFNLETIAKERIIMFKQLIENEKEN